MTRRARSSHLDVLLAAVADPTRRRLFERVVRHPGLTTSELTALADGITRWAVMKHLDVLREAGLVQTMATGRLRRHYAERAALDPLRVWLDNASSQSSP
jgi:DNA-binding transcriptional ArsR family regulator